MHVVIIGGGFGGVRAARLLARDAAIKITLISDEPNFIYHAALAEVAAGKEVAESMMSLGKIFAPYPNVTVVKDRIKTIDAKRKTVSGRKEYGYDELILALGSVTKFGPRGASKHAYGIKTLEEVERFKRHIAEEVLEDKVLDKNYIVVGAGPTGVELAGALNTYAKKLISRHAVRNTKVTVSLVEAGPVILPRFGATAKKRVLARLQAQGVIVRTGQRVESVNDDEVTIDGKKTPTHTVVWTSGTSQHPFFTDNEGVFTLTNSGRVVVNEFLQAAAHIYVLGDNAATKYSGQATTALYDGTYIAKTIQALAHKRRRPTYRPMKYPAAVAVDANWAYVESHGIYASGLLGYWSRRALELQVLSDTLGWENGRALSQLLKTSKNSKNV